MKTQKHFILIVGVLAIAIIIVGYGLYAAMYSPPVPATTISPYPTSSSTTTLSPSSTVIHVLVDPIEGPWDFNLYNSVAPNGTVISLKHLSPPNRGREADIYVGDIKAGRIEGTNLSQFSYSPGSRYYAFRSRGQYGCCDSGFLIYAVDLTNKTLNRIAPPRKNRDYSGTKYDPTQSVFSYIESYAWEGENSLKLTVSFVSMFSDFKYYRISPKELWRYDLTTKQYTLLETLPENATSSTP